MGNCLILAASKALPAAAKTLAIMPAAASNPDGDGDGDGDGVVKVIDAADGLLQEFRRPEMAGQVVAKNRNCFLCSSERMKVDFRAPSMVDDELLQPNQVYFLLPLATSQAVLSLNDVCELAVKAGMALKHKQPANTGKEAWGSAPVRQFRA